eukprot:2250034-Alexandrium_andersonii.AAC.1
MSASLVGSEMCIRDSPQAAAPGHGTGLRCAGERPHAVRWGTLGRVAAAPRLPGRAPRLLGQPR